MLYRIVQFSLRYRGVVVALAAVTLGYGLYKATQAKLDVFPEFAPPQVVIQTEAPGLSPEQVEQLVTLPIENILNGTPGLDSLRSQSIQGLSAITMVFKENVDVFRARQMVSERLTEVVNELPQGVHAPVMGPLTSSTSLTLVMGFTSTNRSLMQMRTFADWTVRPQLLGVPGVAKVDIFGGNVREIQVQIHPDRLLAYGLAIGDVVAAARNSTGIRGAGFIEGPNQRVLIRTEGQSPTPAQLANAVIGYHDGFSVRLKDVAEVVNAPEPKFGDAQIDGKRGVVLLIYSQYGANTLDVTTAVEKRLAQMQPLFQAHHLHVYRRLFRPANFIETSLEHIDHSLAVGGALVVLVLVLFLLDFRTAFISFVSIPISLMAAVIVLTLWGVSINTLTLGGFAIAIGVVVDDAIIDVENILRRLRENARIGKPQPAFRVVLEGSIEVRSAVVYATFIVALVFLPVLAMSGVQGRLFAPLGVAFILATLASLLVALTVTPALCLFLLARRTLREEPRYVSRLKSVHRRALGAISRWPKLTLAVVLLFCAGAFAVLPFLGGEFLPEFHEGHFILHVAAFPGTSLRASIRIGERLTRALLKNPHIRAVSQEAGRAENGEDTFGAYQSEFHVDLNPLSGKESERITSEIRQILGRFPGVTFQVMSFLAERMEETLSGATAEVVVKLFGNDLDALDRAAGQVRRIVTGTPGATDVRLQSQPGAPETLIRLRPDRLQQFGFQPLPVLEAVQTAFEGAVAAQTYVQNRVVNVAVILPPRDRRDPETIGSLMLRNRKGLRVPLRELTSITRTTGRSIIVHEGAQRRQEVTCNVAGRDVSSFVAQLRKEMARHFHVNGVIPVFAGAAQALARTQRELLVHSLIAAAGIILLLAIVFRSGRNTLLVLANLPFALVGGVLAALAQGGSLSVGSLVGFVTLFGITMRNSIMLISHYEHLVQVEGMSWGMEAALRGASERLLPILMTALVTALGLLPLAIGSGQAGREIEGPMAIVILGGLLTSTLLNLLVLPSFALRFGRFERLPEDGH